MPIAPRYRLPVAILASLGVVVVVLVAVIVAGGGGPAANPTPSPSLSASASTDPRSTPEGAVRAFFDAFSAARRTDNPSGLTSFVTSTGSSAYLTASGFLAGQKAVGTGSVLTVNDLADLVVDESGAKATVTFLHHQEGYDIDINTGQPKESPTALPDVTVRVDLIQGGGRWLVDSFENVP